MTRSELKAVSPIQQMNLVLQNVPNEMFVKETWLLWRYVEKPRQNKPAKIPYYTNGTRRGAGIQLDSKSDVDQLAPFSEAQLSFLQSNGAYSGIGFALVGGDGIGGVDLDNCLDESGEITNEIVKQIYDSALKAGAYIEVSPSGGGLRIIGTTVGFKNFNRGGYEAYSEKRYLTITGNCRDNRKKFGSIDPVVMLIEQLVPNKTNLKNAPQSYQPSVKMNSNMRQSDLSRNLRSNPYSLKDVEEMLRFIDPWPYELWLKVTFALTEEYGEPARELTVKWSRGDLWNEGGRS